MASDRADRKAVVKASQSYYANVAYYSDLLAQRTRHDARTAKEVAFLERVFGSRATRKVRRVLDVACGGGRHIVELAARGYDCVGQDFTPSRVDMARTRAERAGVSLRLSRGDATRLPYRSEFDAVLALYVLFLLPSDEDVSRCVRQARAALRRGGVFVCSVYNPFGVGPRSFGRLIQGERQVEESRAPGIRMTEISEFRDTDPVRGWGWLSETTVVEAPDGTHVFRDRERVRFLTHGDVTRILESAGFRDIDCQPDWNLTPPRRPEAYQLVFTARK